MLIEKHIFKNCEIYEQNWINNSRSGQIKIIVLGWTLFAIENYFDLYNKNSLDPFVWSSELLTTRHLYNLRLQLEFSKSQDIPLPESKNKEWQRN